MLSLGAKVAGSFGRFGSIEGLALEVVLFAWGERFPKLGKCPLAQFFFGLALVLSLRLKFPFRLNTVFLGCFTIVALLRALETTRRLDG